VLFGLGFFAFSMLSADGLALAMQPYARIAGAASSAIGVLHTVVPSLLVALLVAAMPGRASVTFGAQALAFAVALLAAVPITPLLKDRPCRP